MIFKQHISIGGHFTIHKGKLDEEGNTLTREEVTDFHNLVLDTGLERWGQNDDSIDYIHLGTGISEPHRLQSTLDNITYSGNARSPISAGSQGFGPINDEQQYIYMSNIFRVPPQGENRTYSEIGAGWNSTQLFSRALIKDTNGNNTTISILGDEYLDITYQVRVYINTGTITGVIKPTGDDVVDRNFVSKVAHWRNWDFGRGGWYILNNSTGTTRGLGSLTRTIGSTTSAIGFFSNPENLSDSIENGPTGVTYSSSPYFILGSATRISDTHLRWTTTRDLPASVGQYGGFVLSSRFWCFQLSIDPPFVKTNEDRFEMQFDLTWGRYEGDVT